MAAPDAGTASTASPSAPPTEGRAARLLARETRCLAVTTALCAVPLVVGFAVGYALVASGWLPAESGARQRFDAGLARAMEMPWQDRFAAIAQPNFKCFALFLVGIVTLGLEATVHLGYLGVAVGIAVATLTASGVPFDHVASLLLPHAGPELLGFCLAGSLGFRAGLMFLRYLGGGPLVAPGEVRRMSYVAAASFALLVAAAFVEAIVTPAMAALRGVGPFPH